MNRRDFLKTLAVISSSLAIKSRGFAQVDAALTSGSAMPPVIWLQGQGCSGCSVSLLNSTYFTTVENLLLNTIEMKYHPTISAASGELAVSAAETTKEGGQFILVIEGAIPKGENGLYCHIWEGMTMLEAIKQYAPLASTVLAVGTCAAYGGMSAGSPNPTGALGVMDAISYLGLSVPVVNLPGCPSHPDWIVGSINTLLSGSTLYLDSYNRPTNYFSRTVHSRCPNKQKAKATQPGDTGCLSKIGCKGQATYADCPYRKWDAGEGEFPGESWCVQSKVPCLGCTEKDFPDGKSPFFF